MSSSGKVIIGIKPKKKKKPLIIAKKNASTSSNDATSSAIGSIGKPMQRSSSPNTVVNTTNNNNGGGGGVIKPAKKKASAGMITIKPFEKPPQIPQNFYSDSLDVLQRALICVLRHEALTSSASNSNGNSGGSGGLIGREELYRSVEDLCNHKFGTRLYVDVVKIMDEASGEVICRLLGEASANGDGDAANCLDALRLDDSIVGYDSSTLISELNLKDGGGGGMGNSSSSGQIDTASISGQNGAPSSSAKNSSSTLASSPTGKRYELLRRMDDVLRVTFINEYLNFVRSIFTRLDRACVYFSEKELDDIVGGGKDEPPAGKVVERSSISQNTRTWGLLEVGLACLRKHMTRAPTNNNRMTDVSPPTKTLTVLTSLVLSTAYAILSEYDNNGSSLGSNSTIGDTRPLVRNCVRTCVDLGALTPLLQELIVGATIRFQKEGQWWGNALSESKRTAPDFLQHVENRLKQSSALTSCYIPSNSLATAALRQISQSRSLTSAAPADASSPTADITWSPINNNTRRIFPAIIESQLLAPHLVSSGILHPQHLYPMLDDGDGSSTNAGWKVNTGSKTFLNAMRLYGLCWRMTQASAPSSSTNSSSTPRKRNSAPSSTTTQETALQALRVAFGEYGRLRGSEITRQGVSDNNSNVKDIKEMERKVIPDLLSFKAHLESLHNIAFRSDESLGTMVRSILEDVMNEATSKDNSDGGRRTAELLAKHVDGRFRDPKAGSSTVPVTKGALAGDANEAFQSEVLSLFRHNQSKDVFEAFFKRDLAKRLLTGRSVSYDMERSFLSKLKAECGTAYTSKMEGMFKDMEMSRDIMSSYAAYASGATNAASTSGKVVDMEVQVLTTGYWPVYPKYPNIILPSELLLQRERFESYYNEKYQGRRIAWQYSLGHCIVKASFPKEKAPKELNVNVCQTLVLLCFQFEDGPDGRGLKLDDIMKKTGIDDRGELERVLQSLSLGRDGTRVLKKIDAPVANASDSPKKKQKIRRNIGEHDRFLFNSSFTNNQRRIRITNITMKETVKERAKTHEAVSSDRLYLIDAAVVRIMKARKTLDHRALMGEVMTQLKFPASSSDIKKRIETLIEREYMERIEGDRSKYKYLA
mmetsp:Transcript_9094/g.15458  ORF Transcript_9094/g.15458 Transcript_9094/m.15458 type:complete len:1104 (+) Transcript_9094:114-3425(+)